MPHPQQHELEVALAKFFADADRSLEVVYVSPEEDVGGGAPPVRDSVNFYHAWVGDDTEDATEALDEIEALLDRAETVDELKSLLSAKEAEDDSVVLLSADEETAPHARVQLGTSVDRRAAAERLGFTVKTRTAYHPASGHAVEIAYAEKAVASPVEAATTAIDWLEQVAKIGVAWLWITDLQYDEWPCPLPRPAVWPPKPGV